MGAYTSKKVKEALRHVTHPGQGKDIVTLNMIKDLEIEGKKISFSLVFDRPNDPFINGIKQACVSAIEDHIGKDAEIKGNITPVFKNVTADENENTNKVKNIIAVASGKGGVGKSTIAANLAIALAKKGMKTGLVDADIYGPSIPKMFSIDPGGAGVRKDNGKEMIIPVVKHDIKILSIGFFIDPNSALVWRGPMASNALKQLINQGDWGELDYLIFDLPPGTSDIHLTLVQTLPVTGVVIVSTPQEVALADAIKGISMFRDKQINVPVIGLVENMAWFTPDELPDNKYYIFGKDGCKNLAEKENIPLLGQIPIVQSICDDGDKGVPSALDGESVTGKAFVELAENVIRQVERRNEIMDPTKKVQTHK